MKTVKEMMRDKTKVKFIYACKGNLWYRVEGENFEFPVPFTDMGDGEFLSEDSATMMMRWINKQVKLIEEEREKTIEVMGSLVF